MQINGKRKKARRQSCGNGPLLEKREIPTRTEDRGSKVLPDVAASAADTMKRHAITANQVQGIGSGVPGPVDDHCTVNCCVDLSWGVFNLKERMWNDAGLYGCAKMVTDDQRRQNATSHNEG